MQGDTYLYICMHMTFPKDKEGKNQWLNQKVSFGIVVLKAITVIGKRTKRTNFGWWPPY